MDEPADETVATPAPRPSSTEIAMHWFAQAQLAPLLTPTDRGRLVGFVGGIVDEMKAQLHDRLGVSPRIEVPADIYRWLLGVGCQHFQIGYAESCARLEAVARAQESRDGAATTEGSPFAFGGGSPAAASGVDAPTAELAGNAGGPERDRISPEPVEDQPGNG